MLIQLCRLLLLTTSVLLQLPAWAYDYDGIVHLSQAEQQVFGRVNTEQSLDERVSNLESNLFGSYHGGSDARRLWMICRRIGIHCPEPSLPQHYAISASNRWIWHSIFAHPQKIAGAKHKNHPIEEHAQYSRTMVHRLRLSP